MAEPIQSTVAGVSLITLAVAVFGPNAGPYIVIVLGSLGGGLWALSSATLETRMQGAWLMLRCLVTAIVLTAMPRNALLVDMPKAGGDVGSHGSAKHGPEQSNAKNLPHD